MLLVFNWTVGKTVWNRFSTVTLVCTLGMGWLDDKRADDEAFDIERMRPACITKQQLLVYWLYTWLLPNRSPVAWGTQRIAPGTYNT